MPSLARILLPVDFSGRSRGAARYAALLGCRFGSQVTLLHAVPPPHYEFSALEVGAAVLSELYAARSKQLKLDLEAHLSDELGRLPVDRVLLEGDPARRVVEYAHDNRVDLIIMPTHGYGPFRRFVLGSVTAKVLHDADCPVMTGVHLEEAPRTGDAAFQRVLAAVDLGPGSAKTLEWAWWLAKEMGAGLTLLHVTPPIEALSGEYFDPEWRQRLAEEARSELSALAERIGAAPEVLIDTGDASRAICAAAKNLKADLLVIGRGSAAGMFGRLRTNAYAIIRQSPCPVASV